jgi:hypothetical protein
MVIYGEWATIGDGDEMVDYRAYFRMLSKHSKGITGKGIKHKEDRLEI